MKFLYLLALFQLVAGPLVLLQVTVFCKLALKEAPRAGMSIALEKAWDSDEFHAVLNAPEPLAVKKENSKTPSTDPNPQLVKAKTPWIAWDAAPVQIVMKGELVPCSDWARMWTPAWPQAPPGPPPRVG